MTSVSYIVKREEKEIQLHVGISEEIFPKILNICVFPSQLSKLCNAL